jgi:prolyl-tRNA editing enzyme YbaK/EbsC (Cys-tRNA(Pro) deacylase)
MSAAPLPASAAKVQAALAAAGSAARVVEMPESTRTAEEAAAACGCAVGQIVKSLVFRGADSGRAWLILVSGANRVHEKRLGRALGEALERADADFVRAATGYAIGGVPPLGHAAPLAVVMDEDLFGHGTLWAAAGTPRAVFPTTPAELERLTGARRLAVT